MIRNDEKSNSSTHVWDIVIENNANRRGWESGLNKIKNRKEEKGLQYKYNKNIYRNTYDVENMEFLLLRFNQSVFLLDLVFSSLQRSMFLE